MKNVRKYVGINNDKLGGMTDSGRVIRHAWVFGLIPETETCEGWLVSGIEELWQKVNVEWEKYGFSVSELPDDLRARFDRIEGEAIKRAREAGWNPELSDDD